MNAHELTDLIFNAVEVQKNSGRNPPYLCMINSIECSTEELHKAKDNLIPRGYVLTITPTKNQYDILAVPTEVFKRNEMAHR